MKLLPVDVIPRAPKKKLQKFIDDFVKSEVPRVEIIYVPGEYQNGQSCYSSFYNAVKRSGYRIRVTSVGDRTFMENLTLCREK